MAINLLTPNLTAKSGIVRFGSLAKTALVIVIVLFITFVVAISALLVINLLQLGTIQRRQETLRSEVLNLEQSEQSLVLIRDRLSKAKNILDQENVYEKVNILRPILSSSSVTISDLNLDSNQIELTVQAVSSETVGSFTRQLLAIEEFGKISITDFVFSPSSGYLVTYIII